jgi:hypothetical protein
LKKYAPAIKKILAEKKPARKARRKKRKK